MLPTLLLAVSCAVTGVDASPAQSALPEVFAPGVISGPANEDAAAFTPDGATLFFDRAQWPSAYILVSQREHDSWSTPRIAAFSGRWLDHDVAMAPDGSFLVFSSNRPAQPDGAPLDAVAGDGKGYGGQLWRVAHTAGGWGEPQRLPDAVNAGTRLYSPYVVRDGSIYFQQPDAHGEFHIWRSQRRGESYAAPERVALGDPAAHTLDPAVAPDESFIVFDANFADRDGPDRLYIAFKDGTTWGAPEDLGAAINHHAPWGAHLGPDGTTLYFSSKRTTPVHYPRDARQAQADLARMEAWDNGNDNLWMVSLLPWIEAHKAPQPKPDIR